MPVPAADDSTWIGFLATDLPVTEVQRWTTTPECGSVVTFTGTVRNHAEGRDDVSSLTYEAYEEQAVPRIGEVVAEARRRWPEVRRVAVLHRVGTLGVGDEAVVVAVGSPHRGDGFAAAAYCIDTVKATVPIWKRETWAGGESWGTDAIDLVDVHAAGSTAADGNGR